MKIENTKQIQQMLKMIITKKELRRKDIAQNMNISPSAFYSRLNQDNMSIKNLLEICNVLNVDLNIEFTEKDDTK